MTERKVRKFARGSRRPGVSDFGKDHWSLLAYVEACVIDRQKAPGVGELDLDRMRCNERTHPLLVGPRCAMSKLGSGIGKWVPGHGTRLSGFWRDDGTTDDSRRIAWHDDHDCLEDLEEAGLVEVLSSVNAFVRLTPAGSSMAALLRQHKAAGKHFYQFNPKEVT